MWDAANLLVLQSMELPDGEDEHVKDDLVCMAFDEYAAQSSTISSPPPPQTMLPTTTTACVASKAGREEHTCSTLCAGTRTTSL